MKIITLIIAGGVGERFWPESRSAKPKQFLDLSGSGHPLIFDTAERVKSLTPYKDIYVVTGEKYKEAVLLSLPEIQDENVILEPVGRNTAPAINLALRYIQDRYNQDVVVVTIPSDQYIDDDKKYVELIEKATNFLENNDAIVTIGINPSHPDTGFGYIEEGEEVENNLYKVRSFKEKPSLEVAKKYVKNGGYLWNAGMFIYKLSTMMHAFQKYMPEQYETLDNLFKLPKLEFYQNYATTFASLEKISIDYGVMEKADNIYVTKGTFEWDDLGSWLAIDRHHQKDENGNIAKRAKVLNYNTKNTTIVSSTKKMFVTIGLEDMVIVNTNDVILIAKKDHIDEVKDVVNKLKGVDNNKYI